MIRMLIPQKPSRKKKEAGLQRIAKPYALSEFPSIPPMFQVTQTLKQLLLVALVTSLGMHVGKCGATTPLAGCSYVVINS